MGYTAGVLYRVTETIQNQQQTKLQLYGNK